MTAAGKHIPIVLQLHEEMRPMALRKPPVLLGPQDGVVAGIAIGVVVQPSPELMHLIDPEFSENAPGLLEFVQVVLVFNVLYLNQRIAPPQRSAVCTDLSQVG